MANVGAIPDRRPCVGCGGLVPDVTGPTHVYMLASPGCWMTYGEWMATRAMSPSVEPVLSAHHVDCYAVQHHGNSETDRRQRQSVAVHLVSLCLLLEFDQPPARANLTRTRVTTSALPALGLAEWPHLVPPEHDPSVTIAEVASVSDTDLGAIGEQWVEASWALWSQHHDTVRTWANAVATRA